MRKVRILFLLFIIQQAGWAYSYNIETGKNVPDDFNAIIEIPKGSNIKYEIDPKSGYVFVDRFMSMPVQYPANYGFIPKTLGGDEDPLDVLVITPDPVLPGVAIRVRAIGILISKDEKGMDEKIIAVPHDEVTTLYQNVKQIDDLPALLKDQIKAFFEVYKKLEKNKWVNVTGWGSSKMAKEKIQEAVVNYKNNN